MQGLTQAFQTGGATLASYGVGLKESTALITAANNAIQDPSRVGNGLKTIAVNMAGLKTSAKDGTISMNKTGKVLKEIAGIDIYANKQQTQVKNMTDILDELHEKWNTLNDVQKKALSEGVAGKTQSAVFNSLMNNYDTYKQMMSEFSSGKQFNSALEENAKYIDSIQGRLASLKATWTGIATTIFNSDALKGGVSAFDEFSQGLAKVLTVLEKTHMTIPAAVASFALLKKAISSIKDAGGVSKALSSLWKNLNDFSKPSLAEKTFTSIATGAKKAMSALTALTGLSTGGLVLALGGVAAAMAGIYALSKWQDAQNMKATNTYNKLTKSVKEHQKALSEATNKENNLSGLYEQYQKLDKITNKNKEQQQQYNQVLQEMAKINPNLVSYDSNGSPIKARENEVRNLIKAYQDAIAAQKKLLANDLKDKANASYDKYKSQPETQKRNDALKEAVDLSRKLEDNLGKNKLNGGNLLTNYLKGYETSKEALKQYYKDLKEVKKAEQEAINVTTKQKNTLNADRSAVLENSLGNVKDIENAGKARKQAIENALKFDFSEFDNSGFEKINSQLTEWLSKADYKKQIPQFNEIARAVEGINSAWSEGQLTAGQYTKQIESQAQALSKLTGLDVKDAIKILTSVEFDATEENKVFSDIEEFHNNIGEKIMQMGDKEVTAEQKIQLAYDIMQDPKTPEKIKEKVAEIVQDGKVTEQEIEELIKLQAQIEDGDLENTLNEKLEGLSKEEEITKEIAIKYAAYVEDGADFNQYMEELGITKEVAMNIKVDMDKGNLDNLKADLEGLPTEQQIGIIVAAAATGEYTPEQIQSFIETLPPEVQTTIKANDDASAIINNVKNNINNVPGSKNTSISATDGASGIASMVANAIRDIPTGWTSVFNATDNASGIASMVASAIKSIPTVWNIVISATQRVTKVISEVHKALGGGGGRDNPGGSSVGGFTNISDTPVESNDVSATGTFSNVSSSPTESSGASEGTSSAGGTSSNQVSSKATNISNASKISTPKIDTSKTWQSVKKGVDLFKELSERIDKVKSNLDLLGEKLDRSVGKNRVALLKQQNKLYEQQAKLTKELYNKTSKSQKQITDQAKKYGFTIKDGFLDNYEETLLKLEKAVEDADKKLEKYNDKKSKSKSKGDSSKEDKKQKALEEAAEKAKTKLENAKKAADAFFDQDKQMADCQKDWEELQNKIKETKDEIEKLEFEDKIYKQKNAIEELNQSLESSKKKIEKYSTLSDRYEGKNKLKNLKLQTEELKKQIQYYKDMIAAGNSEIKQYQKKLKEYGVKFDKDKNISNYDEVLNKYQNSEDLDKIKDWIKEYQDLTENTKDWGNEIEDIINDTQDLNNEIKKIEFENKLKEFSNAVSDANQNMEKLNNELDILDVKLEHASGKEKIDLLDEQIGKWEELIAQQKIALDNMNAQLNGTKYELSTYGFKFDDTGNIINKDDTLDSLKDNAMYDYIKEILEQWEDLYNDKIPNAEKELINYQNSIKDIRDEQLDTIKSVEDKLKDMYKKQLEDRIKQIEEERDKEIEAIEKSRDARVKALQKVKDEYNRQNDEDDYNKQYEEQQNVINELNKKIALAQRDTSLSGKAKLEDLMKQLQDEQGKLQDMVEDRTRSVIKPTILLSSMENFFNCWKLLKPYKPQRRFKYQA